MLITPLIELQLPHIATYLAAPDGKIIVEATSQGQISVMNENLNYLYSYNLAYLITALTISPDGKMLAIKDDKARLIVFQIDGKVIFEEASHNQRYKGKYGCIFSADGKLWDVIVDAGGEVLIQYRETQHWEVLKYAFLPTDDQERYFTLTAHPQNQVINIWEAAGQEGTWNHWVWDDDIEMRVVEIEQLEDAIIPEFHPSGKEFLILNDSESRLCRYSFPDCNLMESITLEFLEQESDYLSYNTCYLSNDKAIVQSKNGRLFMVALNSMEVIDEIIIQGHEPREFNLQDEENYIASDLSWFKNLGENKIISTHLDDLKDNSSTLLLWEIH